MDRIMEQQEQQTQQRPRRVMIGTPCYDGKIEVWYANSLVETIRQGMMRGVEVYPIWLSYDALIQRARNDLVALMINMNCDDIVFIDADIDWNPEDFFKLLSYPVDVVGGTYPKKGDAEMYVAKMIDINRKSDPQTGLIEVEGLGTGFLRMSRRAIQYLWDNSPHYEEKEYGKIRRMIFEVIVKDGDLISEDIQACQKLREGGISIWLDQNITCGHVGMKRYTGNFAQWLERIKGNQPQQGQLAQGIDRSSVYGNNKLNRFIDKSQIQSLYK